MGVMYHWKPRLGSLEWLRREARFTCHWCFENQISHHLYVKEDKRGTLHEVLCMPCFVKHGDRSEVVPFDPFAKVEEAVKLLREVAACEAAYGVDGVEHVFISEVWERIQAWKEKTSD